ncbi:HD domain-containing protein [Candidatus Woesearchaeota archaeon]|nr:HD domain-containing protein [Candidatus Woesearchaeota archaeon]
MAIPSKKECLDILNKNKAPPNVIEHCKTVCQFAEELADKLIKKGKSVNKELVTASAMLHDIEREKDDHIIAGAKLLKQLGFPQISEVIRKHGLYKIEDEYVRPKTIEEKIIFYADKRVISNRVVSLKERVEDLKKRYGIDLTKDFEFAKKVEKELLQ